MVITEIGSISEVDAVAQGRVWTGNTALELGLVDKLGTFDDAVAAAAEKAGLDNYDVQVITQELTPTEQMLKELFGTAQANGWLPQVQASPEQLMLQRVGKHLRKDFVILNQFNDPNGIYSYCVTCSIN